MAIKPFSQMTPEELSTFVNNHEELNRENSVLNKVLLPWLENEKNKLRSSIEWTGPDSKLPKDTLSIGANTVWNSGIIAGLKLIDGEILHIRRLATEARAELIRREEKVKEKEKNK